MTPGDIVMMLNEMGGLRVQATSPSLGAASVRVQGMRGRYTRFLSDGLPLFGAEVGGLGLLQIPPTDLGQVEVIKGVASALYGAGAMGGVVNLISRRPGQGAGARSRSSTGPAAAAPTPSLFAAQPFTERGAARCSAAATGRSSNDVDDDGWADLAGYSRGVVRPRVFWDNEHGPLAVRHRRRDVGAAARRHDAVGGACRRPARRIPSRSTRRAFDGGVGRANAGARTLRLDRSRVRDRAQRRATSFGRRSRARRSRHGLRRARGARHRAAAHVGRRRGVRARRSIRAMCRGSPTRYNVPGVFAAGRHRRDAAGCRCRSADVSMCTTVRHVCQPARFGARAGRRAGPAASRSGSGFFAPTALTEETEAAGLARLKIDGPLKAERGRSASFDVTTRRDR